MTRFVMRSSIFPARFLMNYDLCLYKNIVTCFKFRIRNRICYIYTLCLFANYLQLDLWRIYNKNIYIEYCLRIFRLFVLGESIERNHVGSLHILGNRREIGSVYNFQYVASLRMQQNKTNVRLYDDLWQSTELLQSVGSKIALKNSENSESFLIYRPIMHPS